MKRRINCEDPFSKSLTTDLQRMSRLSQIARFTNDEENLEKKGCIKPRSCVISAR